MTPDSTQTPDVASQVLFERTHLVIPSLPHWIEPTVEYLRHKSVLCGACQETRARKLLVALLEALSNAVIHGNLQISSELKEAPDDAFARALAERAADPVLSARVVDILMDYDGDACRWIITDEGQGFDVERVMARCLSDDPEIMLSSGRGILMMHSFLDDLYYDLGGRRVILTLDRRSGEEKRHEPRVPVSVPFRVAPLLPDGAPDWAAAYDAVSRDFSRHGVALIQEGLAQGQRVLIGITRNGETVYVPAEVRHCRTLTPGCVEVGCEFQIAPVADTTPDADVAAQTRAVYEAIEEVIARHQAPAMPGDERRAHPRVIYTKAVAIEVEGLAGNVIGYARDLSKGGMSLITRMELPLAVTLVFLSRDDGAPLKLRARVVRCSRIQQGFYDIGVQFLRLDA